MRLPPALRRRLMFYPCLLLGLAAVGVFCLWYFQAALIYHPPRHAAVPPPEIPQAIVLEARTAEGRQYGYYVPPRQAGARDATVWLIFGGNATSSHHWSGFLTSFPDPAASFLIIDYPGFGANDGKPSPESIRAAADAEIAALAVHLGLDRAALDARLAIFGHSLGAATALDTAAAQARSGRPPRRVVLYAPFTSTLAMARRSYGWPLCLLLEHRFDNHARLAELLAVQVPIGIVHGDADPVIPIAMSRELVAAFPAIRHITIPGGDHDGLYWTGPGVLDDLMGAAAPRTIRMTRP